MIRQFQFGDMFDQLGEMLNVLRVSTIVSAGDDEVTLGEKIRRDDCPQMGWNMNTYQKFMDELIISMIRKTYKKFPRFFPKKL